MSIISGFGTVQIAANGVANNLDSVGKHIGQGEGQRPQEAGAAVVDKDKYPGQPGSLGTESIQSEDDRHGSGLALPDYLLRDQISARKMAADGRTADPRYVNATALTVTAASHLYMTPLP